MAQQPMIQAKLKQIGGPKVDETSPELAGYKTSIPTHPNT